MDERLKFQKEKYEEKLEAFIACYDVAREEAKILGELFNKSLTIVGYTKKSSSTGKVCGSRGRTRGITSYHRKCMNAS